MPFVRCVHTPLAWGIEWVEWQYKLARVATWRGQHGMVYQTRIAPHGIHNTPQREWASWRMGTGPQAERVWCLVCTVDRGAAWCQVQETSACAAEAMGYHWPPLQTSLHGVAHPVDL